MAAPVAAPAPSPAPAPEPPERIVNTGFADAGEPDSPLAPTTPLRPGGSYVYWLEVGGFVEGSIEETPTELREIEGLPPETRLDVVLFRLGDEHRSTEVVGEGELRLTPEGVVAVSRQPAGDADLPAGSDIQDRRLFFPVRAPNPEPTLDLRCSIYHRQVLLQSRRVTALVGDATDPVEGALRSELDFTLAPRLDGRQLERIPEYSLSLLLNQWEDGTHSLTVKTKQFSDAATFDPVELETLVGRARRALRKTAWDTEDAWQEGSPTATCSPRRRSSRETSSRSASGASASSRSCATALPVRARSRTSRRRCGSRDTSSSR